MRVNLVVACQTSDIADQLSAEHVAFDKSWRLRKAEFASHMIWKIGSCAHRRAAHVHGDHEDMYDVCYMC